MSSVANSGSDDDRPQAAAELVEEIRHELASVSLSIDALAEAVTSGAADHDTVIRLLLACKARIDDIRSR